MALTVVQISNYLFPLITVPYLLRVIGLEKYGLIAFAQSLIQYFVTLTDYGFNLSATRDVSIHRNDKQKVSRIFLSVIGIKFCLMVLSFLMLSVLILAVPRFREFPLLFLLTFGQVIGNVCSPYWYFQGIEKMRYITFLSFVDKLIFTFLLFVFVKKPQDFLYVPLLTSLGFVTAGLLGMQFALREIEVRRENVSSGEVVQQLKRGWHVFITTVSVSAYTSSRTFAVGIFTNAALTGAYALAEKLMNIIQTFPLASLLQAAYPRLSIVYARSHAESFAVMQRLQKYTIAVYLVALPPVFLCAPLIVRIVAGRSYPEAVLAFRLLTVAVFFINANAFRVQFLLISGQERRYSQIHLVTSLIGTTVVFIGAYYWSYKGPAVSIVLIALLVLVATWMSLNPQVSRSGDVQ